MKLEVFGMPAPQGSKRHIGRGILLEQSKKVKPWRDAIMRYAIEQKVFNRQLTGALKIEIDFYLPRPLNHRGVRGLKLSAPLWPTTTPDLDKLIRSTLDGLKLAGVVKDDALFVKINASKEYDDARQVGATIQIIEMNNITLNKVAA
jgi:Holliday junction resolvase RusA-like endonuclease